MVKKKNLSKEDVEIVDTWMDASIRSTSGNKKIKLSDIKINEPAQKIKDYILVRNSLMNLIYSEYLGKKDSELDIIRKQLNVRYDTFVQRPVYSSRMRP